MSIWKKIHAACLIIKYRILCGRSKVRIIDYGRTFSQLGKGSIGGEGTLYLNYNCVSCKESSKIRIDKGGCLIIHGNVSFYPRCNIHILRDGLLEIYEGTYFNDGTKIAIKNSCIIGKNCAISNDVTIMDSDFHTVSGVEKKETGIIIEDHVWLGANSTILKNVVIENNAVVGANAVITKRIPKHSVVVGNPSKLVKTDVEWK